MALEPPGYPTLHSISLPEAGDSERDSMPPPELQVVTPVAEGDTVPRAWAAPDRGPVPSTSGVSSEMLASGPIEGGSLPAGEKVPRPEGTSLVQGSAAGAGRGVGDACLGPDGRVLTAAVPGYQHPSEAMNSHTSQFLIYKIDASSREQRLEDKGA